MTLFYKIIAFLRLLKIDKKLKFDNEYFLNLNKKIYNEKHKGFLILIQTQKIQNLL